MNTTGHTYETQGTNKELSLIVSELINVVYSKMSYISSTLKALLSNKVTFKVNEPVSTGGIVLIWTNRLKFRGSSREWLWVKLNPVGLMSLPLSLGYCIIAISRHIEKPDDLNGICTLRSGGIGAPIVHQTNSFLQRSSMSSI